MGCATSWILTSISERGARGAEGEAVKTARRWTLERLPEEQTVSLASGLSYYTSGYEIFAGPFIYSNAKQCLEWKGVVRRK
jgi:hypothetical protein